MLFPKLSLSLLPLLLPVTVLYAQSKNCFVIGSSQGAVRNLHGVPNSIYKNSETKETWYYGKSSITFKDKLVSEYDNYGRNLKICKEVVAVPTAQVKERSGYLQPQLSKSKATKADTEDWILEKLNANVPQVIEIEGYYSTVSRTQYPGKRIANTSFAIENGDLVVRRQLEEQRTVMEEQFNLPLHDIKRIHADKGQLVFTMKSPSIVHATGRQKVKEDTFSTKFSFTEADIKTRLVSAFSHLQRFYKAPVKKKEVF